MPRTRTSSRVWRATIALALATTVAFSCESAHHDDDRARSTRIPLIYDEFGSLFVEARIHGREPVRLILDTAATRSGLSSTYAERLGLSLRDGGAVEGSAGTVQAQAATIDVAVGDLSAQTLDLVVYGFASYDASCVGILGADFLRRSPFELRCRARELTWNAPPPRATVPLALDLGIPCVPVRVDGVELLLRVDSGASLSPGQSAYINLTADQAARVGLTGTPAQVFTATGTGGATLELPVHRLRSLEIAGVPLAPALAIVQPRVGYFAREDATGFVGNAVLDKLDVYFDYAGQRMAVAPAVRDE